MGICAVPEVLVNARQPLRMAMPVALRGSRWCEVLDEFYLDFSPFADKNGILEK